MEPTLKNGDHVLVWKGIPGARLFNIFTLLDGQSAKIYRLPRVREMKRNDVLVFNAPYPLSPDKMEMHLMKYYVKRCFGLPGDTVAIQDDTYLINGHAHDIKYNSHDSRYWGLLPEDFIVGKVWIIWKSTDPYWKEWRWDRFLKKVE